MPTNIKYLAADGATLIAGATKDFGQVISQQAVEVDTARVKICLDNISDRALGASPFTALLLKRVQLGTTDGYAMQFTAVDTANGTMSKPWGVNVEGGVLTGGPTAADDSSGGSWGSTGAKGVRITALNATGETVGSVETLFTVADTARKWRYDWVRTPDATSYHISVTNTPGDYSAARRQTVSPGTTLYLVDDGSTGSTNAIQATNTSGGAGPTYGTAPSVAAHTADDKTIALVADGGLAVGQQWFFWLMVKVPAGTSSLGNPRAGKWLPTEVT